jgi:hypothetical protein
VSFHLTFPRRRRARLIDPEQSMHPALSFDMRKSLADGHAKEAGL